MDTLFYYTTFVFSLINLVLLLKVLLDKREIANKLRVAENTIRNLNDLLTEQQYMINECIGTFEE